MVVVVVVVVVVELDGDEPYVLTSPHGQGSCVVIARKKVSSQLHET
jgi:hypothetical protein